MHDVSKNVIHNTAWKKALVYSKMRILFKNVTKKSKPNRIELLAYPLKKKRTWTIILKKRIFSKEQKNETWVIRIIMKIKKKDELFLLLEYIYFQLRIQFNLKLTIRLVLCK